MWCSLSHIRLSFDHIEHTIESIFKMYLSVYKLGTFSLYKDCWPQAAPRTEYLSQEDRNVCVCVCVREVVCRGTCLYSAGALVTSAVLGIAFSLVGRAVDGH